MVLKPTARARRYRITQEDLQAAQGGKSDIRGEQFDVLWTTITAMVASEA